MADIYLFNLFADYADDPRYQTAAGLKIRMFENKWCIRAKGDKDENLYLLDAPPAAFGQVWAYGDWEDEMVIASFKQAKRICAVALKWEPTAKVVRFADVIREGRVQ